MELLKRAEQQVLSYSIARNALGKALAEVDDDFAKAYLRKFYDQVEEHVRQYTDLLARLQAGEIGHVDDVREIVSERGAQLMRKPTNVVGTCDLCHDSMVEELYQFLDGTRTSIRYCVNCGLAWEVDV